MSTLARYHPDQPEEVIPPYTSIPNETDLDKPHPDEILPKAVADSRGLALPPIILGCAPFGYGIYAQKDQVLSDAPLRTVRLALRAGITAFDTAPWYHPSEIILGHCLRALAAEYPRESYQIITKVGKYGPEAHDHVYEPDVVKRSVERSLKRLGTSYLDIVYLHDCEFVCDPPRPKYGSPLDILREPTLRKEYKLEPPYEPLGKGDQAVLDSLNALRDLQKEGKIRFIGLAGFPLPVLLRLSLLTKNTAPFVPVDIVQTYSHQTVQNASLGEGYLEAFQQAGVGRVTNAAPLAMGSLTTAGGPEWHPCRPTPIFPATREAAKLCQEKGTTLEEVACDFGYRELSMHDQGGKEVPVPVVVGCKNLEEVHMSLKSFAKANKGLDEASQQIQKDVRDLFERQGVRNVSYYNGPAEGAQE